MISSTAGGPSLSQPCRTTMKQEFEVCFGGKGKMFYKNCTHYLHTLCNASTCKSWKRDDSNLMAWFASTTDRTPNPWCLQKNKRYNVISGEKKIKKIEWSDRNCFDKPRKKRWLLFFKNQDLDFQWGDQQDSIVVACWTWLDTWTMITSVGYLHTLSQVLVLETQRPLSYEQ